MSDQTPNDLPQPEAATSTTSGSRRSKKVVAGAGLATCAALIGGGAVAYSQLSGGGAQPADVLPATADAAIRIDLDPSASQKIEVVRLLNKFPEARETLGLKDADKADLRKRAFDFITERCEDIDYKKDVEPWVGDRFGAAFEAKSNQFVMAIQVTNQDQARKGIDKVFTCSDDDYGLAFYEGYALISETQGDVDDVLDSVKKESLADSEAYAKRYEQLGEPGVASVWADMEGLAEALPDAAGEDLIEQVASLGDTALALRADGSALEVAGVGKKSGNFKRNDNAPSIAALPADSVVAGAISGVDAEYINEAWIELLDQLARESAGQAGAPGQPDDFIAQAESETGLKLPEDVETLLSEGLALSAGERNFEKADEIGGPADLQEVDIALRANGEKSAAILKKISTWLGKYDADLAVEEGDQSAAIGTNQDAAKNILGEGKLGDSEGFKDAVPNADSAAYAYYIDVQKVVAAFGAPYEGLKSIRAVASSGEGTDDGTNFNIRVVLKE